MTETEKKMRRLVKGWNDGDTVAQLAAATGYSVGSVYQTLARLRRDGIALTRRSRGKVPADRSKIGGA